MDAIAEAAQIGYTAVENARYVIKKLKRQQQLYGPGMKELGQLSQELRDSRQAIQGL